MTWTNLLVFSLVLVVVLATIFAAVFLLLFPLFYVVFDVVFVVVFAVLCCLWCCLCSCLCRWLCCSLAVVVGFLRRVFVVVFIFYVTSVFFLRWKFSDFCRVFIWCFYLMSFQFPIFQFRLRDFGSSCPMNRKKSFYAKNSHSFISDFPTTELDFAQFHPSILLLPFVVLRIIFERFKFFFSIWYLA